MPQEVIPYSDERAALYIHNLYLRAGKKIDLTEQLRSIIPGQQQNRQDLLMVASYYSHNLQDWNSAERILRQLIQSDRNDTQAYSELLRVFSLSRQHEKSAGLLEDYLLYHPEDTSASNELKRIKASIAQSPAPKPSMPEAVRPEAGK
jgi:transcription elongation factor GreA-like protein